mgnify:FL=1
MLMTIQVMVQPYIHQDMDTAIKLAEAALDRGHEAVIFLFADSVLAVNSLLKPIRGDRDIPRKLEKLIEERGLQVDICIVCMEYKGMNSSMIIKGSRPTGLPGLADLISRSDRFITLMA